MGVFTRRAGGFREGDLHGQGVKTWLNGERYEGEFRDGEFHGQGVYTWPDGTRIEGRWINGEYMGQVNESGLPHGYGVMTWSPREGFRYRIEGEFRDGRPHGQGVYTDSDGARIEGEWVAGEIQRDE